MAAPNIWPYIIGKAVEGYQMGRERRKQEQFTKEDRAYEMERRQREQADWSRQQGQQDWERQMRERQLAVQEKVAFARQASAEGPSRTRLVRNMQPAGLPVQSRLSDVMPSMYPREPAPLNTFGGMPPTPVPAQPPAVGVPNGGPPGPPPNRTDVEQMRGIVQKKIDARYGVVPPGDLVAHNAATIATREYRLAAMKMDAALGIPPDPKMYVRPLRPAPVAKGRATGGGGGGGRVSSAGGGAAPTETGGLITWKDLTPTMKAKIAGYPGGRKAFENNPEGVIAAIQRGGGTVTKPVDLSQEYLTKKQITNLGELGWRPWYLRGQPILAMNRVSKGPRSWFGRGWVTRNTDGTYQVVDSHQNEIYADLAAYQKRPSAQGATPKAANVPSGIPTVAGINRLAVENKWSPEQRKAALRAAGL